MGRSETKDMADSRRPILDRQAVTLEQSERNALHAKSHASGMRRLAVRRRDVPSAPEQIAVIVEAHASRRMLAAVDRHQQLELEFLAALARCQHLAGPAEERIVGHIDIERKTERLDDLAAPIHPELAKFKCLGRRADTNVFALTEHLH